jgi:hypothetical protein
VGWGVTVADPFVLVCRYDYMDGVTLQTENSSISRYAAARIVQMISTKYKSQFYFGVSFVLYTEPEQKPIGGYIVLPNGEIKAGWISIEYQGQGIVKSQFIDAIKEIAEKHMVISDKFFYYVHDDNKKGLSGLNVGWHQEMVGAWHQYSISREELLNG